ncbi:hypothetical protein H0H81_008341 [Sphagnurus paluster]|uniref:Uncharacterized protein n=1 Tax=Sphagnurus paluster TaxID=117069 RepID=A0A9P7GKM9_9AGAR|nr:hypothetical protein H0H81_008341 [Sphagnurus paluster]
MPGAILVRSAIFITGALVGGGVATAIVSRKQTATSHRPTHTVMPTSTKPIVDMDDSGKTRLQEAGLIPSVDLSSVLKYGNPGQLCKHEVVLVPYLLYTGPIADCMMRKAYVAAYDRRLRHPAWTAEHLTQASLKPGKDANEAGDRSKSMFVEDDSLPVPFRARLKDYFRSGYDHWAYLEEWCRKLTGSFQDVYVFTVPLYLPRLENDGKWRVTHEVIGSPPNVSVPTHFAKVVLTTKPSSPSTPERLEIATGAFVLPNAIIPDEAPLESFVVPVEAVERAAGLTLFSEAIKAGASPICKVAKCQVTIRRFDDAQKKVKAIAATK